MAPVDSLDHVDSAGSLPAAKCHASSPPYPESTEPPRQFRARMARPACCGLRLSSRSYGWNRRDLIRDSGSGCRALFVAFVNTCKGEAAQEDYLEYPFVGRREGLNEAYAKNKGFSRAHPLIKRDTRVSQLIFNEAPLIKTVRNPLFVN